jgi:hypothetical protein
VVGSELGLRVLRSWIWIARNPRESSKVEFKLGLIGSRICIGQNLGESSKVGLVGS